jgi:hypothetical protein
MLINKPPAPAPPVADRAWLAKADRALRVLRVVVLILAAVAIAVAIPVHMTQQRLFMEGIEKTQGHALLVIPASFAVVIVSEVALLVARAIVAAAWSLRNPDGEH